MSRQYSYYDDQGRKFDHVQHLCGKWDFQTSSRDYDLYPATPGRFFKGAGYVIGMFSDNYRRAFNVARMVAYKTNNPSLHKCDGRCQSAKGPNCECSCGGKNHGKNA